MESRRIVLDLPLGVFSALRKTPEEFSIEFRLAVAAKWYERGDAGMCLAGIQEAFVDSG